VVDAETLHTVGTVAAGTNAFLRSTVRGLVRERKRRGIGSEIPFRLSAHADGRLLLDDSATGRRIDLAAFGTSNAEVFASLLLADADRGLVTLH
jgi:putative photosynthetic complex assembly protein